MVMERIDGCRKLTHRFYLQSGDRIWNAIVALLLVDQRCQRLDGVYAVPSRSHTTEGLRKAGKWIDGILPATL
jgi:hypothetical protein